MEALILTCSTGGGHNAAAVAIKEELLMCGHRAEMLDPYSLTKNRLEKRVGQTYVRLVQRAPRIFGFVYMLGNIYRRFPWRSPVYYANGKMVKYMEELFKSRKFDIVITTHLFPAEILTYMKNSGLKPPKTIFVATDYACIPFTEETECDYYVIPMAELVNEFVSRGIEKKKIYPLGIPVKKEFRENISKEEARKTLGLNQDGKYILVSGGSMGAGSMVRTIRTLYKHYKRDKNVKIIAVCGCNRRVYKRLLREFKEKIITIEFTKQMALYMKACNVFITKPGGLSSTEAVVAGIPLIHMSPIPGCESINMRRFVKYGLSDGVKGTGKDITDITDKLLYDINIQKNRESKIINCNAAGDIRKLAEKAVNLN